MSDPLDSFFTPEHVAEMRAALAEATGHICPDGARGLLRATLDNNLQHIAQRLDSAHNVVCSITGAFNVVSREDVETIHALGRAAEAIATARRLVEFSARKAFAFALTPPEQRSGATPTNTN